MKTKKLCFVILALLLLCSCGKTEISLSDTVWKNGNDITVYFNSDGTGSVDVDGVVIGFSYVLSEDTLDAVCEDTLLAESYGLDTLPLFGVNTVTVKGGYMYIGSWELVQVK